MNKITKTQLKELHDKCAQVVSEIDNECRERKKIAQQPFSEMLEQYYDENIQDVNGKTIHEGFTIRNLINNNLYKVKRRGMQYIFGELLFNNRIVCLKIKEGGELSKKETDFGQSDFSILCVENE